MAHITTSSTARPMLRNLDMTFSMSWFSIPGFCIHEIGTARMGNDAKSSVVNGFCQAHDMKNVLVTDRATWVSSGCQNPTLTMMAITARACARIAEEMKRGNV